MSSTATILAGVVAIVAAAVAAWLYWHLLQTKNAARRRHIAALGAESTLAAGGMAVVIWSRGEPGGFKPYLSPI